MERSDFTPEEELLLELDELVLGIGKSIPPELETPAPDDPLDPEDPLDPDDPLELELLLELEELELELELLLELDDP